MCHHLNSQTQARRKHRTTELSHRPTNMDQPASNGTDKTTSPVGSSERVRCEREHDKKWVVLMIVAIGIALGMPWPLNTIQSIVCGLMLAHKVRRLLKST